MDERRDAGWDKRVLAMVVLAFLGAWVSLTLTRYHLSGGQAQPGLFGKVCELSGGGCNQVLNSAWSMLPRQIPLAFAGLVYFSAIALWYLLVGRPNRAGRGWYLPVFLLHLLGALISLFLVGVMAFQLRALCGWCTFTHLLNFVLFVLAWKLFPRGPRGAEPAWPPARVGAVGLLLILGVGAFWNQWLLNHYLLADAGRIHGDTDLMRYVHLRAKPQAIPIRLDDAVLGSPTAQHTVVVFSDFQCPSCGQFAEFFDTKVRPVYGDRLRLVYKHFPLDSDCNKHLPNTVHPNACEASYAAEAARDLAGAEGFRKMHDALFRNKEGVVNGRWADLANGAGLDGAAIAKAVEQRSHQARIAEDVELGFSLKLTGTPSIYIDGRPLEDWNSGLDLWKAILDSPLPPAQ